LVSEATTAYSLAGSPNLNVGVVGICSDYTFTVGPGLIGAEKSDPIIFGKRTTI
jgi:hypothetical protein